MKILCFPSNEHAHKQKSQLRRNSGMTIADGKFIHNMSSFFCLRPFFFSCFFFVMVVTCQVWYGNRVTMDIFERIYWCTLILSSMNFRVFSDHFLSFHLNASSKWKPVNPTLIAICLHFLYKWKCFLLFFLVANDVNVRLGSRINQSKLSI